jgi:hypothetical protein
VLLDGRGSQCPAPGRDEGVASRREAGSTAWAYRRSRRTARPLDPLSHRRRDDRRCRYRPRLAPCSVTARKAHFTKLALRSSRFAGAAVLSKEVAEGEYRGLQTPPEELFPGIGAHDLPVAVAALTRARGWQLRARWRGRDDLDWYCEDPRIVNECQRLCRSCNVRANCAADAIQRRDPRGVWGGGLTPDDRELLAMQTGLPLPAMIPPHGTNSRYAKHGCRCERCRGAHRAYERSRTRRAASRRKPGRKVRTSPVTDDADSTARHYH